MSDKEQSVITQIRLLAMTLKFALEDAETARTNYTAVTTQSTSPRNWLNAQTDLRRAMKEIDDISQRICEQALKLVEDEPCATTG